MRLYIDQEKCSGCGACVEACLVNAINLDLGKAVIDQALCTQCEACVSVCPTEAIGIEAVPTQIMPARERATAHAPLTSMSGKPGALAPLTGATLAFLGREIVPRLTDMLMNALERRLSRSDSWCVNADRRSGSAAGHRPYRRRQRRRGPGA